jgi:hypothetical protein
MRFGDLMNRAKGVVSKRGGTGALKEDAEELRDIARGGGSAQDKAKRAADALKDPGAPGGEHGERGAGAARDRTGADRDSADSRLDAPDRRGEGADKPGGAR